MLYFQHKVKNMHFVHLSDSMFSLIDAKQDRPGLELFLLMLQ